MVNIKEMKGIHPFCVLYFLCSSTKRNVYCHGNIHLIRTQILIYLFEFYILADLLYVVILKIIKCHILLIK
jgi:hypothetical protein